MGRQHKKLERGHTVDYFLQETVEAIASDLEEIRATTKESFRKTVNQLLCKRKAPMLLMQSDDLAALKCLPRFDQVEDKLRSYGEIGDDDIVLVCSHRWWRPGNPDGDFNEKVRIILSKMSTIRKEMSLPDTAKVYLWWDYFSICQTHANIHKVEKNAQILSIPLYLAIADAVLAFKGGDEEAYTIGKGDPTHKGFYDNRVWTMVELYGFTSSYALETSAKRGRQRYLAEVELDYLPTSRCLTEKETRLDRLEHVRASLHDTMGWSLPHVSNLADANDLKFIEPMLIALDSSSSKNRLHVACSFGLLYAARAFLELGDDPNTLDTAGYTPLMVSSRRGMHDILEMLLDFGADPNIRHPKFGVTALHEAISNYQDMCCEKLIAGGADVSIQDKKGRTAVNTAACLNGIELSENCETSDGYGMLDMLLKHGADPSVVDMSGRDALRLAEGRGSMTMAARIRDSMSQHQQPKHTPFADNSQHRPSLFQRQRSQTCFHVEPIAAEAIREEGCWSRTYGSGQSSFVRTVPYIKFSPPEGVSDGPTILLYETWAGDEEQEAERYVSSLNATVFIYLQWQQSSTYKKNIQMETTFLKNFVEDICGYVDCIMIWCFLGELGMRLAADRPDLIGSVIGIASRIMSKPLFTPEQGDSFLKGMCADPAATADYLLKTGTAPAFHQTPEFDNALQRSRECLENHVKIIQKDFDASEEPEKHILGFSSQIYQAVYYSPWAHWRSVTQPVLVIVGIDDSNCVSGSELLAALVPNAEIEYVHGGHYPKEESPKEYLHAVMRFLREHCCGTNKSRQLRTDELSCFSNTSTTADTLDLHDVVSQSPLIFERDDQTQSQCSVFSWWPESFFSMCSTQRTAKPYKISHL
jgi:hypothetical protein